MGVAEALLALLSLGPAHGYQLRGDFEEATGGAWPLNVGQVYTTLQRLERDELVEVADHVDGRVVYRLTETGSGAAKAWLGDAPEPPGRERDEITMRVLLALASDPTDALRVIDTQRDALMAELQRTTKGRGATADLDGPAAALQQDRVAIRCRAEIDWLDLAEERIRRHIERGQV